MILNGQYRTLHGPDPDSLLGIAQVDRSVKLMEELDELSELNCDAAECVCLLTEKNKEKSSRRRVG